MRVLLDTHILLWMIGESRSLSALARRGLIFDIPLGESAGRVGRHRGKRAISADTALRLGRYFKMEPQFWLNLQSNYDLGVAEAGIWAKIKKLIPEFSPARSAAML